MASKKLSETMILSQALALISNKYSKAIMKHSKNKIKTKKSSKRKLVVLQGKKKEKRLLQPRQKRKMKISLAT
jgi:hypothetical protein